MDIASLLIFSDFGPESWPKILMSHLFRSISHLTSAYRNFIMGIVVSVYNIFFFMDIASLLIVSDFGPES